jgi:serine/threonine protein phosphatase 1
LRRLVDRIAPQSGDVLVQLGDCINRGPNSYGVVDYWLGFSACTRYVLAGNHEELMYDYLAENSPSIFGYGGKPTIASYRRAGWTCQRGDISSIPPDHYAFYLGALPWTRAMLLTSKYIFVHAGFDFALDARSQNPQTIRWGRVTGWEPGMPTVVRGHTPHPRIKKEPGIIHVDTGCGMGGTLSCLCLETGEVLAEAVEG